MNRYRYYTGLMLAAVFSTAAAAAADNPYLPVGSSSHFESALQGAKQATVDVHSFLMQRHPVTNGEFLSFVMSHPEWQRGTEPALFADADYLSHWQSPTELGASAQAQQPVTRVSWFAAEAYCEAAGARLPTWYEWELAAAANTIKHDARSDPAWGRQILDWYARPAGKELAAVEQSAADIDGIHDLHNLIWEWVEDFNSLMSSDEAQRFCGGGALTLQQKDNYAVLMRVAMLSSLHAANSGRALGFRCVRDPPVTPP